MSGVFLILAWSPWGLAGDPKPAEKWSASLRVLKIESADAGPRRALSEFKGRPILVTIVGQDSIDACGKFLLGVDTALPERSDVARVVVADLDGVPGLVKGIVRRGVVDKQKALDRQIGESLGLVGRPFPPRDRTLTLLDWDGAFAKELGVSGATEKTYHAYIVDRSGRLVAHMTQEKGDGSERDNVVKAIEALAKADAAEPAR